MPTINYDNNNEDNYTFDPDKIEFVGGIEKLKATAGTPEAELYAQFSETVIKDGMAVIDYAPNENKKNGSFQGGYTYNNLVPGKIDQGLQGISTTAGLVNFLQLISYERTSAFTLECWIKTSSSASMSLISKQTNVTPFTGFALTTLSGKVRIVIRDITSNILAKEHNITINDNVFHHVVATYDGSSTIGGLSIYVDNTQNDTTIGSGPLTTSITNAANLQISGRDGNNNCIDSDTILDEVVVYARELTAAEVAFRWNNGNGTQVLPGPGVSFPVDNPPSIPKSGFQATSINDFNAVVTEPGSDTVEFTIIVDGIEKYWNGSAWVDSTGYPESNQASIVKANIATLTLSGLSTVNHRRYFHSDDGSTTPELDSTQFDFDIEPTEPIFTESIITGSVFDIGADNPDITIAIRPVKYLFGVNSVISNVIISVAYDSNTGQFEARIYVEDDIPDELIWKFGDKEVRTKYAAGSIKFSSLERIYP